MIFKRLAVMLSLLLIASLSFGKNVDNHPAKKLFIPHVFNSLTDTGYMDKTVDVASLPDTGSTYESDIEILPPAVRLDMPVPGDQGKQASCGAWAVVYGAGNYYVHLKTGKPYSDSENLSPAFIYNQLPKGSGGRVAFIDNLELFRAEGACSLKSMPYHANDYSARPDSTQRLEAANYKIKGWERIDLHDLTLLKKAIFEKKPVIFFIATDDGFAKLAQPFMWKERHGKIGTSHSMVIAGYDDERNAFLVMNSWGPSWGDKGFLWIDYQFFLANAAPKGYILI